MKVYVFDGAWALEIIAAASEEEAWTFMADHDGTAGRPDPGRVRDKWTLERVYDLSEATAPECLGHYSG